MPVSHSTAAKTAATQIRLTKASKSALAHYALPSLEAGRGSLANARLIAS